MNQKRKIRAVARTKDAVVAKMERWRVAQRHWPLVRKARCFDSRDRPTAWRHHADSKETGDQSADPC